MTKKEAFLKIVKAEIFDRDDIYVENYPDIFEDAKDYFNGLSVSGDSGRPRFTDNGKLVLEYMQENVDTYNNLFKAKDIGEGMEISSRTVSGAMRKLVNDAYVEKVGENPTVYSLTAAGKEVTFNEE